MIPAMTSRYHDWGILALGFSAGAVLELAMRVLTGTPDRLLHAIAPHLLWGAAVGPLVVFSLLLRSTVPHRVVLVAAAIALVMFFLGLR